MVDLSIAMLVHQRVMTVVLCLVYFRGDVHLSSSFLRHPFDTLLRTLLMSMAADLPSGQDLSQTEHMPSRQGGGIAILHPQMDFPWNSSDQPAKSCNPQFWWKNSTIRVLTYMSVLWTYQIRSDQIIIHRDQSPMPGWKRGFPEANQFWHRGWPGWPLWKFINEKSTSGTLNRTSSCPPVMFVGFKTTLTAVLSTIYTLVKYWL